MTEMLHLYQAQFVFGIGGFQLLPFMMPLPGPATASPGIS